MVSPIQPTRRPPEWSRPPPAPRHRRRSCRLADAVPPSPPFSAVMPRLTASRLGSPTSPASAGRLGLGPRSGLGRAIRLGLLRVEQLGRGRLIPQIGEHVPDRVHDQVRDIPDRPGVDRLAAPGRAGRSAARPPRGRPCAGTAGASAPAGRRRTPVRPPVRHRDDREVAGQRQHGHAGSRSHRPVIRLPGDGALRVDHHHLARPPRPWWPRPGQSRRPRHRAPPGSDPSCSAPFQHRHLPQRRLRHDVRESTGLADVHRVEQRVDVRDVIGHQQGRPRTGRVTSFADEPATAKHAGQRIQHALQTAVQPLPFS